MKQESLDRANEIIKELDKIKNRIGDAERIIQYTRDKKPKYYQIWAKGDDVSKSMQLYDHRLIEIICQAEISALYKQRNDLQEEFSNL